MGCGASSAAGAVPPTQQATQEVHVQQAPPAAAAPAAVAPAPQQEEAAAAAPPAAAKAEEQSPAHAATEAPAPAPVPAHTHLFQAGKIGDIEVKNRFVMAPMTRCRATPRTHVPTPIMATYYDQRASAGLIVTECTMASPDQSAFYADPGIHSDEQVAAWKAVTEAVHAKGGKIICQIWHAGRAAHSVNGPNEDATKNPKPVAPSPIAIKSQQHTSFKGEKMDYEVPHELTEEEITAVIADFVKAAKNAIEAGFDGVEVHGANGYLIDQFWRACSNQRPAGRYSGATIETRSQFALDVVAAVAAAIGAGKVGIRISPLNSYNDMMDPEPEQLTRYLCTKLSEMQIAYVHLMRADFFQVQKGDAVTWVRESFKGFFITNMGYQPEEAEATLGAGTADAVAFGAVYTANPDLVERVQKGVALAAPDPTTFYQGGEKGYIDFPAAA